MNHSSSFNHLESMSIIKNLTSKDQKEQQEGIDQIKKILLQILKRIPQQF